MEYIGQDENSVDCKEPFNEDITTFWHEVDMSSPGASSSSTPNHGPQTFYLADDEEEPQAESASSSMKSNPTLWHFPCFECDPFENAEHDPESQEWKVEVLEYQRSDEHYFTHFGKKVRMKDKQGEALIIDTGSPENLCGDEWSHRQKVAALVAGRPMATYAELPRPLEVSGVGEGSQLSTHAVRVHLGMPGGSYGTYEAHEFKKSSTPALLGQKSLSKGRVLIDCFNKQLYHIGPDGYNIQLSPGSARYPLVESHYGHLMLPCSEFKEKPKESTVKMPSPAQVTTLMPRCEPTAVSSGRGFVGAAETPIPRGTYTQIGGSSSSTDWRQWRAAEPEGAAGGTRQ